jgi:Kef-type K+ transport system membrane component KefB
MRRLFVLSVLFGIMAAVEILKVQSTVLSGHITLAAIGFVVLASFTMSELGASLLKLPKVTGFIIAGIVLGPQLTNILSTDAVTELRMFNTLALGLIALNAGLELSVKSMRSIARTLSSTILAKLVLLPVFVGTSVFIAGKFIPDWAGIELNNSTLLALCLIFSALAIGTSPAIAIAVSSELKAKGKLTDLVLGNAIFKDLVVVIVLAIAIAVSRTLIDPNASLGSDVIVYVFKELGLSIALGLACGLIIIAYTHFIGIQMLLFVMVLILAASEISAYLHTELLLVFISAGFVVRNFSDFEHDVLDPLEKIALPTFIVFFTIAGASIDLIHSLKVLPVALLLFASRGLAYYLSARIGGHIGREQDVIQKSAWLGYLPQAGVTLGLIGIASKQLGPIGQTISTLGMTVVALNLLAGPVALRIALRRAGEIPEDAATKSTGQADSTATGNIAAEQTAVIAEERATESDITEAISAVSDENLRHILARVDLELHKSFRTHIQSSFQDWQNDLLKSFEAIIISSQSNFKLAEEIQDWARMRKEQPQAVLLDSIVKFRNSLNKHIEALHYIEPAPFEERHYQFVRGDSLPVRLRKLRLKISRLFRRKKQRKVPLRALVKIHILESLSAFSNEAVRGVIHSETKIYSTIREFTDSKSNKDQIIPESKTICNYLITSIKSDYTNFLARTYRKLATQLNDAGSPLLPASKIRVSEIEPRLEHLNTVFDEVFDRAKDLRALSLSGLALSSAQRIINLKLNHLINESVVKKISETSVEYKNIIAEVRGRIEEVRSIAGSLSGDTDPKILATLKKAIEATIDQALTNRLDRLASDLSYELSVHKLAIQLKKIAYSGGGTFIVREVSDDTAEDDKLKRLEVDLQAILDECLVDDLIPEIEASVQSYKDFAGGIRTVADQISKVLSFSLESESGIPDVLTIKSSTVEGVDSAYASLNDYVKELDSVTEQVTDHILQNYYQVLDKIEELTYSRSLSRSARDRLLDIQERLEFMLARHRHHKPVGMFLDFIKYTQELPTDLKVFFRNLGQSIRRELSSESRPGNRDMLRHLSSKLVPRIESSALPPLFRKGFSLAPVKDRRFFVANNDVLKDILDTERDWMSGQNTGGRLVIGEAGSGKTSIINICQLELKTERVYRTDPNRIPVRGTLLTWIARNVNSATSVDAIERALRREKSVVLVDNLEQWIAPTPQGIGELKSILELMSRTSRSVFWIVTVTKEFYQYYANVLGLDLPFGKSLFIESLSPSLLQEVINNRLAYSGIKMNYKQTMAGSWLHRIRLGNDEDIYFRVLSKLSYGNIRAALSLWINSIRFNADKSATPSIVSLLDSRFPYKEYLPDECQTILLNLLRHGAMRERELSSNLQWGHERIYKILNKLSVSGQIYRTDDLTNQYEIHESLKVHISQALQQAK